MADKPSMTIEAIKITGECNCHEAYTSRKMIDPNCHYHEYAEEISEAITEAYERGRRDGLDDALPTIGELAGELDRVLGALLLFEERIKDPTPQHIEQFIKDGKSSLRKSLKNHQERLRALIEKEPTK